MSVANMPIVAFVLTLFIWPTSDGTFVGTELDSSVPRVDVGGCSCLVELRVIPPSGVTTTDRPPPCASVGASAAREGEATLTESGLVAEVAEAGWSRKDRAAVDNEDAAEVGEERSGA